MSTGLCASCENSILCSSWGEWKCVKLAQRIYDTGKIIDCRHYKKRGKNFEEPKCQCEECLKYYGDEE